MSETNSILSTENMPTIIAVTFVLALLSLGFNFYTFSRLNEAANVLAAVDVGLNEKNTRKMKEHSEKIAALEQKVAELEKKAAAPPPAPAEAPEGGE